jgi:hypothetical protein
MQQHTTRRRPATSRSIRWGAFALLVAGLVGAVALDAHLDGAYRVCWFGALLILDLLAASWLTKPRTD